ncbi:hypothetical protein RFI_03575 [Reticulomyxa filosa]|uniref:ELMO domain-containing protein n=1 Tax=Reticulomyxa filosa TaxID=46433 RepID=X6P5P4_RETFI|nr:hypothetical protein RFI_03575 [Reticulomyxa filosa]|eukprot:ETO33526.1 hypothetical protein RFI_03575 [Reticulomyxa filosa]
MSALINKLKIKAKTFLGIKMIRDEQRSESLSDFEFETDRYIKTEKGEKDGQESEEFNFDNILHTAKRLKPSAQQQAQDNARKCYQKSFTDVVEVNNRNSSLNTDKSPSPLLIQANILSEYLQPTNILAPYVQNSVTLAKFTEDVQGQSQEKPANGKNDDVTNLEECQDVQKQWLDLENKNVIESSQKVSETNRLTTGETTITFAEAWAELCKECEKLEEREQIFKMAKLGLNQENKLHSRIMQKIWSQLIKSHGLEVAYVKIGSQWEKIGFQGTDPATDVRGYGMLGVLQLLWLIEYLQASSTNELMSLNDIVAVCNDPQYSFPFAITAFEITGLLINSLLRTTHIYDVSIQAKSIMSVLNRLFVSFVAIFLTEWKKKKRTIVDFNQAKEALQKRIVNEWKVVWMSSQVSK